MFIEFNFTDVMADASMLACLKKKEAKSLNACTRTRTRHSQLTAKRLTTLPGQNMALCAGGNGSRRGCKVQSRKSPPAIAFPLMVDDSCHLVLQLFTPYVCRPLA